MKPKLKCFQNFVIDLHLFTPVVRFYSVGSSLRINLQCYFTKATFLFEVMKREQNYYH